MRSERGGDWSRKLCHLTWREQEISIWYSQAFETIPFVTKINVGTDEYFKVSISSGVPGLKHPGEIEHNKHKLV